MNKNILTIAGFDPSGCAGVIADIRTIMAWRMFGVAVVTGLTAQNTQRVDSVYPVPLEVIGSQLESVVADIEIHAVKIGMMPDAMTLELVAELVRSFQLQNVVVDPVLRSSTGFQFADDRMIAVYKEKVFPLADVVTPNLAEAAAFADMSVHDVSSMKEASEKIYKLGARNVVITGGHLENRAMDVLYDGMKHNVFDAPKITSVNTRGIGCTFASVLAVHLAKKMRIHAAIDPAKKYIARAIVHPFKIGSGNGPLNHNVAI